jgi:lysozyme
VRRLLFLCVPLLAACVVGGDGERVGVAQQANVCATGATLEGVDVSVYDGAVDWTQLKSSGRAFGIAKATEGSSLSDAEFATNWAAMKSAGIVRSAYHFFHCDSAPATQASSFLGVMGALQPGDLPPSLDFEDTTTCTASTGVSMAVEWLDAVASATGTLPILYTSVNVLSQFDGTQSFAGHAQLWVASRGVTCPALPMPFTAWSFWQYSLTGTAPGLPQSNGMADLDQFNGDMGALLALTVGGASTSASTSGSSTSGGPPCMVDGVAGTCIDTSVCATMAGYISTPGLCPGPATEQCCTPVGGASSASTGSASGAGGAITSSSGVGGRAQGGGAVGGAGSGGASASQPGGAVGAPSRCAAATPGTSSGEERPWASFALIGLVASRCRRRGTRLTPREARTPRGPRPRS